MGASGYKDCENDFRLTKKVFTYKKNRTSVDSKINFCPISENY